MSVLVFEYKDCITLSFIAAIALPAVQGTYLRYAPRLGLGAVYFIALWT